MSGTCRGHRTHSGLEAAHEKSLYALPSFRGFYCHSTVYIWARVSHWTTSTFSCLLNTLALGFQHLDFLKVLGYIVQSSQTRNRSIFLHTLLLGAMSGPRKHFAMGLVLLLCALTGRSVCAPSAASPTGHAQQKEEKEDYRRLVEAVRHVDASRGWSSTRIDVPLSSRSRVSALEARDLRSPRTDKGVQGTVFPRNLKKKGKFLQHITGPLYFSHKCRKHVYRLYHQTRDCTIPAYYKRCARLLTRLAGSPLCMEG